VNANWKFWKRNEKSGSGRDMMSDSATMLGDLEHKFAQLMVDQYA